MVVVQYAVILVLVLVLGLKVQQVQQVQQVQRERLGQQDLLAEVVVEQDQQARQDLLGPLAKGFQ
jgi:hypothetical protein